MKSAFVNGENVLTGWGYAEANGSDTLIPVDEDFNLHPGEWKWDGGSWVKLVDDLTAAKEAKKQEINAAYSEATAALSAGYPRSERESWAVQVMESESILNNTGVGTPWINAAASARGITPMEMAEKIRDMDVQYRQVSGALTGKRQALRDQIDAASTVDEVEAITWGRS